MSPKKNPNTNPKLSAEHKVKVISLLAGGWTCSRIVAYLDEECGVQCSVDNIYHNYKRNPKYKGRIKRIQNILDKNLAAHPLASKVNRLDLLLEAANEAMMWRLDKIHYDKEGNELDRVEKRNVGVIPKIVEQARKEIEGEGVDGESKNIFNIVTIIKTLNQERKLNAPGSLGESDKPSERLHKFLAK